MDMNKLLGNLNDIENGTFDGPSKTQSKGMKKILESFDAIEGCGDPMPAPMQAPMPAPEDKGQPVSMNINLNATGKDNVDDLMALIKAVSKDEQHVDMPLAHDANMHGDANMDMSKLKAIMTPEMEEGRYDGPNSECCDAPLLNYNDGLGICSDCKEHAGPIEDEEATEDCYANEPEEDYKDTQYMTHDLAGGLNKEKKSYPKAADGDNPMALEAKLKRELAKMYEAVKSGVCTDCGKPSYTTLPEEKQKGVDGKVCWKGYKRMGTKKKGGKTVDNCVKM